MIQYYFEAINRDRKEAIEFFPRLLELIEIYPENGPLFRQCVSFFSELNEVLSHTDSSTKLSQ